MSDYKLVLILHVKHLQVKIGTAFTTMKLHRTSIVKRRDESGELYTVQTHNSQNTAIY